jgi:hypothetical protein
MRQPTDQGTGSRFSIPPGRHAAAVSEAERIDSVLRGEGARQPHEALKAEVALASRMEERIVRQSHATIPVGRRRATRRATTSNAEQLGESGVAERRIEAVAESSEGTSPLADDTDELASG